MAGGGRKGGGGGGERVLEGRHVIGLFVLMLLFSGVFFTLGYVMGRNQYDGQVRAASAYLAAPSKDRSHAAKPDSAPTKNGASSTPADVPRSETGPAASEWEFYHAGEPKKDVRLTPAPAAKEKAPAVNGQNSSARPSNSPAAARTKAGAPMIPGGAMVLQVAALTKESDALALAESLQKRKFPAFVLTPGADHFYRVQVGPYADQQSATIARKGLESAGFKAILKR